MTELFPLNGLVLPTSAAKLPVCDLEGMEVAPAVVQPVKLPVSKPPLTTTLPVPVTVRVTEVECVADAPVPVTVRV